MHTSSCPLLHVSEESLLQPRGRWATPPPAQGLEAEGRPSHGAVAGHTALPWKEGSADSLQWWILS